MTVMNIHVGGGHIGSKKGQMSNRRLEELVDLEVNEDGYYVRECARCGTGYESKTPIGPRDCSHAATDPSPCPEPWAVGGPISGMLEEEA